MLKLPLKSNYTIKNPFFGDATSRAYIDIFDSSDKLVCIMVADKDEDDASLIKKSAEFMTKINEGVNNE